jgi:hypothetical protein
MRMGMDRMVQPSSSASSGGMKTPVLASYLLPTSGSTSPIFVQPAGSTLSATFQGTAIRAIPIPFNGTVGGLYTNLAVAQTSASIVDTINGTAGAVGCAYTPSAAPFDCNDTSHSDSVNAGDLLQWKFSLSSGTWAQTTVADQISFILQSANGQQGMLAAGVNNGTGINGSNPASFMGLGAVGNISATTELNVSSIMPTAGQIAAIYVTNNGLTETTTAHQYQVWKNGASTTLSCTTVASPGAGDTVGCCANLTGTGTVGAPGSTVNCTAISAVTVAAGDTISVDAICSTAPSTPCSNAIPGISLLWLPTTAGQAVITSSTNPNVSNPFIGFSDNVVHAASVNAWQIAPYLGSSTLTFSNLLYCTKTNPGGTASRVVTSQSGSAPNVTPSNVPSGTVATASVANGACPGANSAVFLGGNQDNTHTWTAPSGASLVNSQADVGGPAGGVQAMKYSYVAVVAP